MVPHSSRIMLLRLHCVCVCVSWSPSVLTWAVKSDCGPYRPSYLCFSCTTLDGALPNRSQCSVSTDVAGTAQLPIRIQHLPSSRLCQALISGRPALTWWNSIKLIQNKWTGVSSQRKIAHSAHLWQPWPATSVLLFCLLAFFFSESLSKLLVVSSSPSLLLLYFSLFKTEAYTLSHTHTHTN